MYLYVQSQKPEISWCNLIVVLSASPFNFSTENVFFVLFFFLCSLNIRIVSDYSGSINICLFWRLIAKVLLRLWKLKCKAKTKIDFQCINHFFLETTRNNWGSWLSSAMDQFTYWSNTLIWATENTKLIKKRLTKQADWNRPLGTHASLLHASTYRTIWTPISATKASIQKKNTLLLCTPILHKWHFPSLERVNTKVPKVIFRSGVVKYYFNKTAYI